MSVVGNARQRDGAYLGGVNLAAKKKPKVCAQPKNLISEVAESIVGLAPLDKNDQPITKSRIFYALRLAVNMRNNFTGTLTRFSKRAYHLPFSLLFVSQTHFYILTRHLIGKGSYKSAYDAIEIKGFLREQYSTTMKVELRIRGCIGKGSTHLDNAVRGAEISRAVNSVQVIGHGEVELNYSKIDSRKVRVVKTGKSSTTQRLILRHTAIVEKLEHDLEAVIRGKFHYDRKSLMQIALGAAQGIRDMHKAGYSHLDVKETNILVKEKRGYLIDLDFALDNAAIPGFIRGSFFYMPPEVITAKKDQWLMLSSHCDNWAFGVVLYTLFHPSYGYPTFLRGPQTAQDCIRVYETLPERQEKRTFFEGWPAEIEWEKNLQALLLDIFRKTPSHRPTSQQILDRLQLIYKDI